jgi:hypothetical protein
MPVKIKKVKGGKYQVSTPNGVKSKGTSKAKAKSQERLLNAVEHGWKPTGKKNKKSKSSYRTGICRMLDPILIEVSSIHNRRLDDAILSNLRLRKLKAENT